VAQQPVFRASPRYKVELNTDHEHPRVCRPRRSWRHRRARGRPAEAGPGEVRVRLAAAGVCHSDLSFVNGTLMSPRPIVLGPGRGSSRRSATASTTQPGDRVLLNWTPACRDCWYCANGESYLCP
jgi:D-arabinose 1-dehydrogenase-like Zn-dependent alcohol dehydrogenase